MMNHDSDDRVSELLEELGPVSPPDGFTSQVMAQVSLEADRRRAPITRFNSGGIMIRKAMLGLAAAAAIVLVVYSITGFPPAGRGTEGTIGAAQKQLTPQIADKDVKLGDREAQEFLQSDAFEQLARDAEARELITNASMRGLLGDAAVRQALARADVRAVLTSKAVHNLYRDAETRSELESQLKANVSANAVNQAAARAARVDARAAVARVLSDDSLRSGLSNNLVRNALDNGELRNLMADARMARALNSAAFMRAISHNGFASAFRSDAFATRLAGR